MASIDKLDRKNKPFRVRFRSGGRAHSRTFATITEAKKFAAQVEADKSRGIAVDSSAAKLQTVGTWSAAWLATRTGLASNTRKRLRTNVENYIGGSPLAGVRLDRVRPMDVERWLVYLGEDRGLARTTQAQALRTLKQALDAAVSNGLLARSPARDVRVRGGTSSKDVQLLSHAEVARLVAAADKERPGEGEFVRFLSLTGLRIGEAFALQVADVRDGGIHVTKATKQVEGTGTASEPKHGRHRVVPVPASLRADLEARTEGRGPSEPLWPSPTGVQRSYGAWWPLWRRVVDRSGVETTPHALRHYTASVLVQAGADVRSVAEFLGHADSSVTLRVYAKLFPTRLDDLAALL